MPNAIKELLDYGIRLNAKLAAQRLLILKEMEPLSSKATLPNVPVGMQVSATQRARLQALREQLLAIGTSQIIVGGYLRDANVISDAAKVAHAMSQGYEIGEQDPRAFYSNLVVLMRVMRPADGLKLTTPDNPIPCRVDAGLHFDEQLALRQINQGGFLGC
ncbi:MAG: hypothetical protein HYR63_29770 [Proteobacteria bacterium]|nr:hypothetical protein [Pseudomonadota bacterium]MBI3498485.1 hypothetical protein [Pseudomonadota bacterium]